MNGPDSLTGEDLAGAVVLGVHEHRWHIEIQLRLVDGSERTMVASADSYFTERDGIWWSTREEYEEEQAS